MSFQFLTPSTLPEVLSFLGESPEETLAMAGGTDLLLAMDFGRFRPRRVVSLARLPWRWVRWEEGVLSVGSLAPLRDVERAPGLSARLPALWEALRDVGSVQLRHRATLGGNIVRSSPVSDLLPPLLASGATLRLVSQGGVREVPLDGFLRGSWRTGLEPGELIQEIRVPAPQAGAYLWQRVRPVNDISQVSAAASVGGGDPTGSRGALWHLAAGGVDPVPQRLPRAERALTSVTPGAEEVREAAETAAEEFRFRTDQRATEGYRRHLFSILVRRAVERARTRWEARG